MHSHCSYLCGNLGKFSVAASCWFKGSLLRKGLMRRVASGCTCRQISRENLKM